MDGFIPEHSEIHISCAFTWDRGLAEELALQWRARTKQPVKTGGPAFYSDTTDFRPGMYLKPGIVFTTRGCNNNCPWCCVPRVEGMLRELPVCSGNRIQDNNFLQADRTHRERVFAMLRTQKGIRFSGGLEAGLVDDHFVSSVTSLRISELWLACDTDAAFPAFRKACKLLRGAGFTRKQIRCYALIGDHLERNENRLRLIYDEGAMPFAQLRRDFSEQKTQYPREWKELERIWQRPALTTAYMRKLRAHGSDFAGGMWG